jgi:hypothetical protein
MPAVTAPPPSACGAPLCLYFLISFLRLLYQVHQVQVCDQVKWSDLIEVVWQETQLCMAYKQTFQEEYVIL